MTKARRRESTGQDWDIQSDDMKVERRAYGVEDWGAEAVTTEAGLGQRVLARAGA